jgi:sulfur transfer protein SufE
MCLATVRGFISLLVAALFGEAPAEVLAVKPTLLTELGLVEALRMVRARKRLAFTVHKHCRAVAGIGLTDPNRKRPPRLTETRFC